MTAMQALLQLTSNNRNRSHVTRAMLLHRQVKWVLSCSLLRTDNNDKATLPESLPNGHDRRG